MIKWTPQKLGIRLHCCVCQISTDKQREGLTIQSEGGVNGEGEVWVIRWSVWLNGGLGQRGEKTTAVDRMGLF